jgi:hypothetical protein
MCVNNGGHYDEVFPKSYLESAAVVQCKLYCFMLLIDFVSPMY